MQLGADTFDLNRALIDKKKKRWDFTIHRHVRQITTMPIFNAFVMLVILINSLVVGLETIENLKKNNADAFFTLNTIFLVIYTIEFALKVYAEPKNYWKSSYNIFDFAVLALSYVQVLLDNLRVLEVDEGSLKILRLLRVARTLRTISFVEGLQVLVNALIVTIRKSVVNVVVLLVLLMIFFGVVGYYIFGYDETGDKERWGSLSDAMLTLFTFVTADGWTQIQKRLDAKFSYSQWFTVIFIFLGHFIFTNLFIGIIIMNIHESTERYNATRKQEKEAILQLKKDYLYKRQREDVKHMLEKQKNSKYANFAEMTQHFRRTLSHDDYVIMTDVACNLTWLETYIDSLDHLDMYSYRCQQAHFNMTNVIAELLERKIKKKDPLSLFKRKL
ncbi:cation channel sperm-associated protein 3-like [Rhopilema esculentum]|uniref:cation channel sperm-associated protein 3-like n=1 Tax=Rhopilema esculentum TaxID=499914 RepID=UPI0031D2E588